MATAPLKKEFRQIKRGRPGHRFIDHYARERKSRGGRMSVGRIWRLLLGTALVVVGLILCVIPGPGLPFIFLGGALLASQFKMIARAMDWFELRVRTVAGWALRHWKKLPLWARLVVGAVIVAGGFASMYFFYWLMHR